MKTRLAFIALALTLDLVAAEPVPSRPVKTEKEVRFQIVEANILTGSPVIIRIDTSTGKTWCLRLASDSDRKEVGVTYMWIEFPEINYRDDLTAAGAVRNVPLFAPAERANAK